MSLLAVSVVRVDERRFELRIFNMYLLLFKCYKLCNRLKSIVCIRQLLESIEHKLIYMYIM